MKKILLVIATFITLCACQNEDEELSNYDEVIEIVDSIECIWDSLY